MNGSNWWTVCRRTAVFLPLLLLLIACVPSAVTSTQIHRRRGNNGQTVTRQLVDDQAQRTNLARHSSHRRRGAVGSTQTAAASTPSRPQNCSGCATRQLKQEYRLESIKSEILRKLRLRAPPNVTRPTHLPDIPQIQTIVHSMSYQSDSAGSEDYSDNEHATTMTVMLFPTSGWLNFKKSFFQWEYGKNIDG
jgi:hypothetical protein